MIHMRNPRRTTTIGAAVGLSILSFAAGVYFAICYGGAPRLAGGVAHAVESPESTKGGGGPPLPADSVELSETQLKYVKVEAAGEREFPIEKTAIGSIDFNEELLTQVFTQYPGRINGLFAKVGDEVKKGQLLFTIDSPDLLQASSTLISAAGVLQLTTKNLARLKNLFDTRAISQKELEQATSDHQTAEGALRAARDAVRIFGKTEAEMDRMVAERRVDPTLVVGSPIAGRITARNAAPGLFVQPGNPPAPFTVADISTMWMLANVTEGDSPAFKVGQEVSVSRVGVPESGIRRAHHHHRLRRRSQHAPAIGAFRNRRPEARAAGRHVRQFRHPHRHADALGCHSPRRRGARGRRHHDACGSPPTAAVSPSVRYRIGLVRDGYNQIIEGLQAGELVATEGAIFLSNALTIAAQ